ncbi:pyrroloquinoline quinone biosynthesis protein PqqB [Elioraea sp.]|uniref:pyrroloquinoline quinone biosynthesis protein PqqB n=1 Tax=Elioraea sp. TaxID=2185103 RepID=UPI00307F7C3C
MLIRILGAAAGGGFPQWNCGCPNCDGLRRGTIRARPRSQVTIALSGDADRWVLMNCGPDIRAQIEAFPALWPRAPRHSPIAAIVLTCGDLDHTLGLLSLRENHPLTVLATETVRHGFVEGNALYRTLERFPGQVTWRTLVAGLEVPLDHPDPAQATLFATPVPVPGKPPVHLEGRAPAREDQAVGLIVRDLQGRRLAAFPGAGGITPAMRAAMAGADALIFDGTFWSEDELARPGLMDRRAAEMAHLPIDGKAGSLALLADLAVARKLFVHINNTNPILREDGAERARVEAAGWTVAEDGMEIAL